jgi:hypothetical protein
MFYIIWGIEVFAKVRALTRRVHAIMKWFFYSTEYLYCIQWRVLA